MTLLYILTGILTIMGVIFVGGIIWFLFFDKPGPDWNPHHTTLYRLDDEQYRFIHRNLLPFIASYYKELTPSDGYAWQAFCQDRDRLESILKVRRYDESSRRMINDWTELYKKYQRVN